jgi:hypothetical protein
MRYCYEVESGADVGSHAENRSAISLMDLDRDPKGYPLVPEERGNLANMKRIIRSFVTAHYRNHNQFYFITVLIYLLSFRFCIWPETGSGPMEAN